MDERFNQTLQNMLCKYIGTKKEQWEQYLDTCIYAYNTSIHESARFSPFELMFTCKPVLPIEINMGESDPTVTLMGFHERADFTFSQVETKTAKTYSSNYTVKYSSHT